jgi:hypothetical protein
MNKAIVATEIDESLEAGIGENPSRIETPWRRLTSSRECR